MYQIAICDDDSKFREAFYKQVLEVFVHLGKKAQICEWSSLQEARDALKQTQMIDLIFLDIELEKQMGMELGRYIREELLDFHTQIVYVSYEQGYAMELFDTEPLDFLIKPVTNDMLLGVCRRFLRKQKKNKQLYYYKAGSEIKALAFEKTMYFQSMGHKVVAYTQDRTEEFYGKLGDLEEIVPACFVRIHKSYLVNTHFVQSYCSNKVILCNQEELLISRSYKEQVRNFVSKRLEEM